MSYAREQGMIVLKARCLDQGAEALLPLRDALRSYGATPSIPVLLSESGGTAQESLRFLASFARIGGRACCTSAARGSDEDRIARGSR